MAGKSIIIIGAGVAGLSTGCYAQMNGYDTQIFEMHDKPGGLCTAWKRGGYTIDGCLRWLVGTSPNSSYRHLWDEVGALRGKQIINLDQFYRIEGQAGKVFTLYTDPDRLQAHMKEIAPEDSDFIDELTQTIRKFAGFNLPADKAMELYGIFDNLKVLNTLRPFMGDLQKWGKTTMKDLAMRFKNPLLREAWQMIWPSGFSALFIIITIAWMASKNAGYIIGGSMEIARSMEKRYLELGGKIHYRASVAKVLVQNDRATGVRLVDGQEYKANIVISAADGHATIFDMLEGKYIDDKVRGYYDKMPIFGPLVYVGLGVNRSFDDLPKTISGTIFALDKPLIVAGKEHQWLNVRVHNFDPTLAPPGKTVLTVMIESEYSYWESLQKDPGRYKAEKEKIADDIIAALDKRFPGLASQVEARDVATPYTFHRYTGNWQGCYEGWLMTPDNIVLQMKKNLPGLDNFYMVGHWVQPAGGLPSGLMTGCHVMQVLCKHDNKRYCAVCPH